MAGVVAWKAAGRGASGQETAPGAAPDLPAPPAPPEPLLVPTVPCPARPRSLSPHMSPSLPCPQPAQGHQGLRHQHPRPLLFSQRGFVGGIRSWEDGKGLETESPGMAPPGWPLSLPWSCLGPVSSRAGRGGRVAVSTHKASSCSRAVPLTCRWHLNYEEPQLQQLSASREGTSGGGCF